MVSSHLTRQEIPGKRCTTQLHHWPARLIFMGCVNVYDTGFGKSICYEVLPFMFDKKLGTDNSLVIVVSPLVSLMVDQVHSLRSRSVKVSVMFCTTLTPRRSSILGGTRCFATVGPKIATASLASIYCSLTQTGSHRRTTTYAHCVSFTPPQNA